MKDIKTKIEKERQRLINKLQAGGVRRNEEINNLSLLKLAELAGELKKGETLK